MGWSIVAEIGTTGYRCLNYSDPFGLCPENAANGTLCVDLFIQAKTAWGFRGDNRGFDANADASRSRMQITFRPGDETGRVTTTGSCGPLGCYAPYKSNNVSIAAEKGGSITVKYNAEDSAGYGLAFRLNGTITFTPDGKGGWNTSGNRDNYPNLGIYQRTNGAWKTLQELPGAQDLMGPARMAAPWPKANW